MIDDLEELRFQSFLQEVLVSSSDMGRDVHMTLTHKEFELSTL